MTQSYIMKPFILFSESLPVGNENKPYAQLTFMKVGVRTYTGLWRDEVEKKMVERGIGLGLCLAVVISWSVHKSILWAIFHGILGWLYVLYYALMR